MAARWRHDGAAGPRSGALERRAGPG